MTVQSDAHNDLGGAGGKAALVKAGYFRIAAWGGNDFTYSFLYFNFIYIKILPYFFITHLLSGKQLRSIKVMFITRKLR